MAEIPLACLVHLLGETAPDQLRPSITFASSGKTGTRQITGGSANRVVHGRLPMFGVMRVGFGKLFPICQEGGVGSGVVCALPVARKVGCNFATCAANDVEDLGRRVAA
jgi:hypothetical protein